MYFLTKVKGLGALGILDKLFLRHNKDARQAKQICTKLHDTHVKYACAKTEDGDNPIIGRDGHLNITDGNIFELTFGVQSAFRYRIEELSIWEFMSLDGATISGPELNSGQEKSFIVYYDKHLT